MAKHLMARKPRHRHAGPLYEQIFNVLCSIPAGWMYVSIYVLGAAVGVLLAVLVNMIKYR